MKKRLHELFRIESLFLFSIFLFRFPPIYFLGIPNSLLTTEAIAILLVCLIFIVLFVRNWKNKAPFSVDLEIVLVLCFFFTQSISVLAADNISSFLYAYWKIILGMIIFIIGKYSLFSTESKFANRVLKTLIFGAVAGGTMQLFLFFFPHIYNLVGKIFVYSNVFNITNANASIGKIIDDTYFEIVTPILIYFLFTTKKSNRNLLFVLYFIAGFLAFVSNLRARFLIFVFSSIFSLIFFMGFRKIRKKLSLSTAIIVVTLLIFLGSIASHAFSGYTVIDRFLLAQKAEDYSTIEWRFNMYKVSFELALSNPILGIGLGNMYDALPSNFKSYPTFYLVGYSNKQQISDLALRGGTHNIFFQIFGETGFLGITSFLTLLIYWAKKDMSVLVTPNGIKKTYILSFWTLIGIAQFFPATNPMFFMLLFLFRSFI